MCTYLTNIFHPSFSFFVHLPSRTVLSPELSFSKCLGWIQGKKDIGFSSPGLFSGIWGLQFKRCSEHLIRTGEPRADLHSPDECFQNEWKVGGAVLG